MNGKSGRPRRWFARIVSACLIVTVGSSAMFAAQDGADTKPIERTMSYDLFTLERTVRQVPPDADKLLRSAIADATTAAVKTNPHPKTREEALAVLEAIQVALVKHNFIQPLEEKDWPDTIGIAFKPLTFAPEDLKRVLSYAYNDRRAKYLDLTKPLYYVDCDMGAQLFLAVGERLGWDIRLVEIPQHDFVRWHLSDSVKVNWDWTRWSSDDDSAYLATIPATGDPRLPILYLRSFESKEAKAYYVGLIGSQASAPKDGERLLQEAVAVLPNHPLTLNNLAWLYATDPGFTKDKVKSSLAVAYSLAAWSVRPYHGNFADTVACAFAADGNRPLAEKIEEFAIEHPNNIRQREDFRNNLNRIVAGEICK